MATINTQYRNYIFPLKDEDLETSNNLLRITTEAIDIDMNTLFTTKADASEAINPGDVDTKISTAITAYDSTLDIYGTYANGDVNTDGTEPTKLVLPVVMGNPGVHTKLTVNEKGQVTSGAAAQKSDISDFTETDYVHIGGTETVTGSKTFSGVIEFSGTVNLPDGTGVDPTTVFDDGSVSSSTKGYTIDKLIGTFVPLTSYTDALVLAKIKTVDGDGSGLDADLLDGEEGTFYTTWTNFTATPTTLSGYGILDAYTKTETDELTWDWSDITSGLPTTIAGFGISDAYTESEIDTKLTPTTSATASRPTVTDVGTQHFDTDLGYAIWWDGTNWVDATGTTV